MRFAIPWPAELDVLKPRPEKLKIKRARRKARKDRVGSPPNAEGTTNMHRSGPGAYGIVLLRRLQVAPPSNISNDATVGRRPDGPGIAAHKPPTDRGVAPPPSNITDDVTIERPGTAAHKPPTERGASSPPSNISKDITMGKEGESWAAEGKSAPGGNSTRSQMARGNNKASPTMAADGRVDRDNKTPPNVVADGKKNEAGSTVPLVADGQAPDSNDTKKRTAEGQAADSNNTKKRTADSNNTKKRTEEGQAADSNNTKKRTEEGQVADSNNTKKQTAEGPAEDPMFGMNIECVLVETHHGHLGFTKGKTVAGESPLQTAERETFEESGIAATRFRYLPDAYDVEMNNRGNPCVGYFVAEFVDESDAPQKPPLKFDPDELRLVRWFNVRDALASPALRSRRKLILQRAVQRLLTT